MNKKYLIPFALILLCLSGCQDLTEDPKGNLTPVTYFKTQTDLDAAVASIYVNLAIDGAYGFTSRMTSYFGADDLTTDPALNKADFRDFDKLSGGALNPSMVAQWQGPWTGIYQANNVIANYEKVTSTEELKNGAAGQAFFLRAWGYYNLVRTFGEVPLILTPIDVNERPDRTPVSEIYAAIVSDLKTAKSLLPASFPDQPGKADIYAATAMLADVYLTMAGWPLNDASNYALAAAEAQEVINSGAFTLMPDYTTVFNTNNNSESIFALQYNVGGSLPQRSFGSSCVPLEEAALNGQTGWDDYYPEINFYLNAPACKRTDATFYTTIKLKQSNNTFNLVSWDSPQTHGLHPYYKKFREGLAGDPAGGVVETETSIISMGPSTNKALDIIRYPLVLLDFAEASTMATGAPSAAAYDAINQVRERAGLPDLTPGLSQAAFRDAVVFERGYEFAGEFGIRWFDIVRLQLLPQVVAARNEESWPGGSPKENIIPNATKADPSLRYLAPIPQNEMFRNPAWVQNPGY
ncbi:MAG TPA: RagB/SusD family nutrient uptake outer membrane protein [Chryseolinea sp.]|nr:RagB/SusD family nutrient uptake outer membrane protein [Chryseolinea sp.]